jgi:hypothetical protein
VALLLESAEPNQPTFTRKDVARTGKGDAKGEHRVRPDHTAPKTLEIDLPAEWKKEWKKLGGYPVKCRVSVVVWSTQRDSLTDQPKQEVRPWTGVLKTVPVEMRFPEDR